MVKELSESNFSSEKSKKKTMRSSGETLMRESEYNNKAWLNKILQMSNN